jgi:preprotein translocase subunit SecD
MLKIRPMGGWLKFRLIIVLLAWVFAILFLLPTLSGKSVAFLPKEKIRLGLDLQGGTHLLLEVKTEEALSNFLTRLKTEITESLKSKHIFALQAEVVNSKIELLLLNEEMIPPFEKFLADEYPNLKMEEVKRIGDRVKVTLNLDPKEQQNIEDSAVDQALETIRNRIDQLGVTEPEIARQGERRILVQLPGIKDPERAKSIIGKTALLEFKLVDEEHDLQEALSGNVPEGSIILYGIKRDKNTGRIVKIPYLLKEKTLLTGDAVKDARVAFGEFNRPYISLTFTSWGAKEFERITGENVGKRLAIILDGTVYSAPVIREKISGGKAVIEGDFTIEEARDLAIVLRAGALPASLGILEERTVGPSLGKDLVEKGVRAVIIGGLLVLLFMIIYYRFFGVVADLALILNLLLVLAVMVMLKATLTLPGIAGLALTVGMGVDANILIFERIKEELREGKPYKAALDNGYSRALLTIFDAQITTLIAALFLFQFGTGPIKGFAVTLSLGILINLFTSIFTTKAIFDWLFQARVLKELRL